ncbi:hypothetical protein BGZ98_004978, partial [Dissophora globulifera]
MTRMHIQTSQRKTIDIGDGLIMRWSTKADTTNVCTLASDAFRWFQHLRPYLADGVSPPNEWARAEMRCMLSGKSAMMSEFDYAVVEDTKREEGKNPIVVCVSLHHDLAYYGPVNVHLGKPEVIANDSNLRQERTFSVYLRQSGYDLGLTISPNAKIESTRVPPLAKGKSESNTLRVAKIDDLPFLKSFSTPTILHTGAQIGVLYTAEYWRYTVHDSFEDKQSRFDCDRNTRIIVDPVSGKDVGCTAVSYVPFSPQLQIMALDEREATYVDVADSILRQLFVLVKEQQACQAKETAVIASSATSETIPVPENATSQLSQAPEKFVFNLVLHEKHPLHGYPIFIKAVAPELEKRLANSVMAGTTGRLRLDFSRQVEGLSGKGLEVVFEKGKIAEAIEWANFSPECQLEERLQWKKDGITPT